jgi:hypothetical protein
MALRNDPPAQIGCENKESSVNEAQSRPNGSRSNFQTTTVKACLSLAGQQIPDF